MGSHCEKTLRFSLQKSDIIYAGKPLTQKELQYLRQYNPVLYMQAVREDDPAKQYVVAAIQETVKEFKESEQYKKLPETEEQAEEVEKEFTMTA